MTSPPLRRVTRALGKLSDRRSQRGVEITLTDDATIADLAGRYRGSPYPTDVLAFSYDDDPRLAGEVVISIDTARRQARERGVELWQELLLLSVHGLWHVSGVGDESQRDWREMRINEFETMVKLL